MEMKKLLLFSVSLVLILGAVQSFDYHEKEVESEKGLQAMYDRWSDHHKVTEKSPERFKVFKENVFHVHNHNKLNKPYKLKVNRFADMTDQEFKSTYVHDLNSTKLEGCCPNQPPPPNVDNNLPPRIDWREKNAVTAVRLKGRCGNSYLFGAVGAIEGINAIRTGQLIQLSEQQFMDCRPGTHSSAADAIDYYKKDGAATAESYPYEGCKKACDRSKFGRYLVTVDGYMMVGKRDEAELMKAVSQQPVMAYIFISPEMRGYSEGVYGGPCGTEADVQGVLLVGYDQTPQGEKYWIAKNIWGQEWGEKGYIRLPRGVSDPEGFCHLYKHGGIYALKSIETRNTEL